MLLKRTKLKEGEHTTKYQEHQPNSIGAKLVCNDDCLSRFYENLQRMYKRAI